MEKIAEQLYDIQLFRFLFPILAIVGFLGCLKYGIKGIREKRTISLFRIRGLSVAQSRVEYTGIMAQIIGIIYLLLGFFFLFFLGGISFYLIIK